MSKNFLGVLQRLNNTDKHNLLILAGVGIVNRTVQAFGVGFNSEKSAGEKNAANIISIFSARKPIRITEEGTEVIRFRFDKPEPDFKIEPKIPLQIVFDDIMPEEPILYIIAQIRDKVVGLINSFGDEFE